MFQYLFENLNSGIQKFQQTYPDSFPYIYAVASSFFFSFSQLYIKLSAPIPTYQILYYRDLFLLLINLPYVYKSKYPQSLYPRNTRHFKIMATRAICGGLCVTVGYCAIQLLPIGTFQTLNQTMPIWAQFFSYIIDKKNGLTKNSLIFTLTSFLGILFITQPEFLFTSKVSDEHDSYSQTLGYILALFGAISLAGLVSITQLCKNIADSAILLQQYYAVSTLMSGLVMIAARMEFSGLLDIWLLIKVILIAIFSQLGQKGMTEANFAKPASQIVPISYLQVIICYVIDVYIFDLKLEILPIIGSIIILISSFCTIIFRQKQ